MARPKRSRNALITENQPVASTSGDPPTDDGVPLAEEQVEEVLEPPQKKRKYAKSAPKPTKKNVMPLQDSSAFGKLCEDMLIEIFSYLTPPDLLHLSWTSKGLHGLLTADDLASVWRKARTENIPEGIPDCPDDIKEPQYANLMFGDHCFLCAKRYESNDMRITWRGRFRACIKCVKKKTLFMYIDEKHPQANKWAEGYPRGVLYCLPAIDLPFGHSGTRTYYHLETHRRWKQEYRVAKNQQNWADAKANERMLIDEHAYECRKWQSVWENHIVRERERMILKHLKKLGWEQELAQLYPRVTHPLHSDEIRVACKQRLTKTDLEDMEPFLNKFMERIRAERLARERRDFLRKRIPFLVDAIRSCRKQLPPNALTPDVGDVFQLPLVRDIINSESADHEFAKDDLNPFIEAYPEISLQWRLNNETKLVEMIKSSHSEERTFNPDTVLRLATSMFSCYICRHAKSSLLWYPRVLIHAHAASCCPDKYDLDIEMVHQLTHSAPWNCRGQISFLKDESLIMASVLKELGFDPTTTTAEEMNASDPMFECLSCNDPHHGRYTMKWMNLAHHISECHSPKPGTATKPPHKFEMLQGQEAACIRARFAEDNSLDRASAYLFRDSMICVHCRYMNRPAEMADHVWTEHGIADPTDADIVPNLDTVPVHHHRYSWPPRKVQRELEGIIV